MSTRLYEAEKSVECRYLLTIRFSCLKVICQFGGVAERLKAPVLKTGNRRRFVGSNPTATLLLSVLHREQSNTDLLFHMSFI